MKTLLENTDAAWTDFTAGDGAEPTNTVISDDPNFENPEWREDGKIDGVPVSVYFRTTPEDQAMVTASGDDWGTVTWGDRITRIEVDLVQCDRDEIASDKIRAVVEKYESGK